MQRLTVLRSAARRDTFASLVFHKSTPSTCVRTSRCLSTSAATDAGKYPQILLKPGKVHIFSRHRNAIVYGGAVGHVQRGSPVTGDAVLVCDASGEPFAWGFYNPVSMDRVRVMEVFTDQRRNIDENYIQTVLEQKVQMSSLLRKNLGLPRADTNAYRLINSEGDGLSGLCVDVMGTHAVVAVSAAWVLRQREKITAALQSVLAPNRTYRLVWRPAVDLLRKEEGWEGPLSQDDLPSESGYLIENGIKYSLQSSAQQKTGFYADQRDSRALLRTLANGKSVLDLCCYTGGFALSAGAGGAERVLGIDSSEPAIAAAQRNAAINGLGPSNLRFERHDLKKLMAAGDTASIVKQAPWDIVVLDPPKLAPSRASLARASRQYLAYNAWAMGLVKPGGLLMTCSCSGSMTQSASFVNMLQEAARRAGRRITILREAGAGLDHPIDPGCPEGRYLTNMLLRVL